ncbi:MAG: TolC family protein [Acidobacteriota bacterium]
MRVIKPPSLSVALLTLAGFTSLANAQPPNPAIAPPAISLTEALTRARQYAGQIQSASLAVLQAKEDIVQARANRLPVLNAFNQYIHTEGNGTPSGVFVANDGVHIYNEQAQVHEEVLAFFRKGETHRALAAEAAARARVEVASRGLNAVIIQNYFAIVAAQRRFANAQTSLREAASFLDITEKQEKGGEAAHADVVKARIQSQQRQRDLLDAQANIEKGKIALGVLIFPDFSSEFSVVDDLAAPGILPPPEEARAQASATSPDLKAAQASLEAAGYDVNVARYGYLPSLSVDFFYGINANEFTVDTLRPGELPRHNLGYSGQVTLNIPVWNWGATRSRVAQAELRRAQARLDLSLAGKVLRANVAAALAEARAAQQQLDSLRDSLGLAVESLRLTLLRYTAGEAIAFKVVDAQSTVTTARNAYDDGQVRYRIAQASLQSLTGSL